MKKFKALSGILLVVIMLMGMAITGCGSKNNVSNNSNTSNNADGSEKNLRLSWTVAQQADHPYTVAATTFADVLKKETNGNIKVDLYPGGQLGGDVDLFQSIQEGNLDVGVISAPVIASFTKVLAGTDMPYIFNNDYDLMYKAESGEPGQKLLKALEQNCNVKALSFLYQPWRHFFTNKEIKSIDDMKGLKLRCMQTPVHIDIFKALGTSPVTLPYNESYSAMQTGTIDGFESDVIGANASKFYEVSKYITVSGHFNNAVLLLMSDKCYDSLTPDEQKAVQDAASAAARASLECTKNSEQKYMQVMQDQGVKINEVDLAPFKQAVEPVIAKYSAEVPEVKEFVDAVKSMSSE